MPPLSRCRAVAEWIRFHTGARVTADPQQAAFAIIAEPAQALPFDRFALGTAEYPDRSTTLVLQVDRFGGEEAPLARRPGHCGERQNFAAAPLPADLHATGSPPTAHCFRAVSM